MRAGGPWQLRMGADYSIDVGYDASSQEEIEGIIYSGQMNVGKRDGRKRSQRSESEFLIWLGSENFDWDNGLKDKADTG